MKIVISSGHGLYVRGAAGPEPWGLDEVNEARRVTDQVANFLEGFDVEVVVYHDNVSTSQDENLNRIVDFHNAQGPHELDVSIHFNAYEPTESPMGCEVWFMTQDTMAAELSATMSHATGFIDRGAKYTDSLYFLNETAAPSVLLECCFVDSHADVDLYHEHFEELCAAIASILAGRDFDEEEFVEEEKTLGENVIFSAAGPCSWFGGPEDTGGVDADEGLAFFYDYEDAPHLFLPKQPPGTTGLARRLNPEKPYVACRWNYDFTPKAMLADPTLRALVRAPKSGLQAMAWPADWGPNEDTGRAADLSPGLMEALKLQTDDEVEVLYPAPSLIV